MPVRVRPRALVFSKVASGVFRKPFMPRCSGRSSASLPLNPAAMRTGRGVPSACLAIFLTVWRINSLVPSAVCALSNRRVAALPVNSHQHKQTARQIRQGGKSAPQRAKAGTSPALRAAVSGPLFTGSSPVRHKERGFPPSARPGPRPGASEVRRNGCPGCGKAAGEPGFFRIRGGGRECKTLDIAAENSYTDY